MDEGVKCIILYGFRLNCHYESELFELIVQMVQKHPEVELCYQIDQLQEEE